MRGKKGGGARKKKKGKNYTYNTRDSLVVTDPTTNPAVSGLTRGERTGSRVLQILWSYVLEFCLTILYIGSKGVSPITVLFKYWLGTRSLRYLGI